MREQWIVPSVAALLGVALAGSSAQGAPITFNTALPVSEGNAIFRGQAVVVRASDDPSAMDRSLTAVASPGVFAYGATRDLALFAVLPFFVHKSLDVSTQEGRVERSSSGFGDAAFIGRYTLLQVDRLGETLRVAPFAGFKAPTGEDDESDSFGRLPRPLQPGSGSWDAFLGSVLTWQTLGWELDADAGYQFNTEHDGFEFGDVAFADASFQYRLLPRQVGPGVPGFLYGVVETNLVWQEKNRIGGRVDPDSGGFSWFLDPGIQYVTKRFILEAAVVLPAVQDLNGDGLGSDYEVRAGFRWNFSLPELFD